MSPRSDAARLLAQSSSIVGRIDRLVGIDDPTAEAARRVVADLEAKPPYHVNGDRAWHDPMCGDPWCKICDGHHELHRSLPETLCTDDRCECRSLPARMNVAWIKHRIRWTDDGEWEVWRLGHFIAGHARWADGKPVYAPTGR